METTTSSVRQKRPLSPSQDDDNAAERTTKRGKTPQRDGKEDVRTMALEGSGPSATAAANSPANIPSIDEITNNAIKASLRCFAITLLG